MRQRAALVRAMDARLTDFDGLVLPTVPIVAPRMADVADVAAEDAVDTGFLIRNTVIANVFDLCAISLTLPRQGGLPVGLMLVARNGGDRRLLRMAAAVRKTVRHLAEVDSPREVRSLAPWRVDEVRSNKRLHLPPAAVGAP